MVRPGHRLSASAPVLASLVLTLSVTLAAQEAPRRAGARRAALVEQGLVFLKSNDLDRARGSFGSVPADCRPQLAVALQQVGARSEARTHFTEAQRLSPRLIAPTDHR
jgi:hypothetical protein